MGIPIMPGAPIAIPGCMGMPLAIIMPGCMLIGAGTMPAQHRLLRCILTLLMSHTVPTYSHKAPQLRSLAVLEACNLAYKMADPWPSWQPVLQLPAALVRHCGAVSREERTKDATWVGYVMDA